MYKHFIFGEFIETENLITLSEVKEIIDKAEKLRNNALSVTIDEIIEILHKTSLKWRSKSYYLRNYAVKVMPEIVGFSSAMVKEAINQMAYALDENNIKANIRAQLRDRLLLDKFVFQPRTQTYLKLQNLGIVLHVSAGNVFVGPIDSLIQGILTKNINILKLSTSDPVFPLIFLESLKEADKENKITPYICAIAFAGGTTDIEDEFKKRCDAVVVWGGDETVTSYRKNLPNKTKLIQYGPKISFSVLTAKCLKKCGIKKIAEKAAHDIIMWEGRACSSPQTIYIEEKDKKLINDFIKELAFSLEKIKKVYPQGKLSADEKVEITKTRFVSKMDEAFGESEIFSSEKNLSWTIVYDKKDLNRLSPLNRFIFIKSYKTFDEFIEKIKPLRYYLQTCSVGADPKEFKYLVSHLTSAGVNRITEIGMMSYGKPGSPHDGVFELGQLVKWVDVESFPVRFDLITNLADEEIKKPNLFNAVNEIFEFSKKFSPFYRQFYKNKTLKNWDDFYKLPVIDKNHLYKNTPPRKNKLLTGHLVNGYIFSSGGTTGSPKFSFYNYDEFEEVTNMLTYTYLSAGINNKDIVANLFVAGNLWASFMAVNEALEEIGCITMPISGNSDINLIINFIASFKANVIMGLPSIILQLAHHIEVNKIKGIKIEKILYGGEHFTMEAKKYLNKILGAKIIRSAGYASVDAGPIGFQCEEAKETIHHVLSDYVYLQIINPKTLKPVPAGEEGEIAVTLLKRKFMPLIKYRTGDLGRIIPGKCSCGRDDMQFELLGRSDEVIRVGTVSIYPQEFVENFSNISSLSHIYQIEAGTKRGKDTLKLRIELKTASVPKGCLKGQAPHFASSARSQTRRWSDNLLEQMQNKIRNAILKADPELAEAVREKWLQEFKVEVLPSNTIPRTGSGGKGKVRRIVDKRIISNKR